MIGIGEGRMPSIRKRVGCRALLATMLLLTACGQGDETAAAATSEHEAASCSELREGLEDAEGTLKETFGSGDDGHEARMTIIATVDEHPECFNEREQDLADHWRDQEPYESPEPTPPVED
jgi:hypothetical protein